MGGVWGFGGKRDDQAGRWVRCSAFRRRNGETWVGTGLGKGVMSFAWGGSLCI